jgi:Trp operon repressor
MPTKDTKLNILTPFEKESTNTRLDAIEELLHTHTHDGRDTKYITGNIPRVSRGSGVPTSTPKNYGDIYVRTTGKVYIATGTSSASDWKILN